MEKKDGKKYGIFLEVHLSNNQFISKYYNLKEKTKREIPNILYIVTDQPLQTEKLRYFDPAFHSITPEGFQSRLTFLHQCTRQGPTNSAMDSSGINTRNLSFIIILR